MVHTNSTVSSNSQVRGGQKDRLPGIGEEALTSPASTQLCNSNIGLV